VGWHTAKLENNRDHPGMGWALPLLELLKLRSLLWLLLAVLFGFETAPFSTGCLASKLFLRGFIGMCVQVSSSPETLISTAESGAFEIGTRARIKVATAFA
jgi:hypothetical protein